MHLSTEGVSLKVAFEPDMGQLVRIQGATKKKIKEEIVGGGTERCFCYGG